LILSYQRDVDVFLREAAARLDAAVEEWRLEEAGPGEEYFRVLTYYRHANVPADNFALRKVLHFEAEPEQTIHSLLGGALDNGMPLHQMQHSAIAAAYEKSQGVARILSEESEPSAKADSLGRVVLIEDVRRLALDLEAFPIHGDASRMEEEEGEEVETAGAISPVESMPMVRAKG
jgi:hypothetical protein